MENQLQQFRIVELRGIFSIRHQVKGLRLLPTFSRNSFALFTPEEKKTGEVPVRWLKISAMRVGRVTSVK